MARDPSRFGRRTILLAAIALAPGCGAKALAPPSESARKALDAALAAWKGGQKPEGLASAVPPVHPVDFQWQAGQALDGYEILAEEPAEADAPRAFAVRLRLKGPARDVQARYLVLGRDDVWVYRAEDYERTMNMDNNARPDTNRRR